MTESLFILELEFLHIRGGCSLIVVVFVLMLVGTVAHKYHGKTFFLTAKFSFPRQNFLSHGRTLFSHGKTFFSTAKLSFSRQNSLFSRQNSLFHGKTFFLMVELSFLTAKLSFPRQNFLFHGRTFFLSKHYSCSRCRERISKQRLFWLPRSECLLYFC